MARSYRRTPCIKGTSTYMKRQANRRVRRKLKNTNFYFKGNQYRRIVEPYDVCDWKHYFETSFEKYYKREVSFWLYMRDTYGINESPPDRKEVLREYKKLMRK